MLRAETAGNVQTLFVHSRNASLLIVSVFWPRFLENDSILLRMNLFTHRDIWAWLDKPFEIPPVPYEQKQLKLYFT
jgi:hypothetical protein